MFKGSSCYPISPCEDNKENKEDETLIDQHDQMLMIMKKVNVGSQDLSHLYSKDHVKYVQMLQDGMKKSTSSLKDLYPEISEDLVDILEQMLQFNPHFRPTTKELLNHHAFDDIRTDMEITSNYKILIDVDDKTNNAYDKQYQQHNENIQ